MKLKTITNAGITTKAAALAFRSFIAAAWAIKIISERLILARNSALAVS